MGLMSPPTAAAPPAGREPGGPAGQDGSGAGAGAAGRATLWARVAALGLALVLAGLGAGEDNRAGMIVFAALTVSAGVTALLGLAYRPESTGIMYGLCGFAVPGYSLPFFVYFASKGAGERAASRRRAAGHAPAPDPAPPRPRRCRSCGAAEGEYHHPGRCTDQAALLRQAVSLTRRLIQLKEDEIFVRTGRGRGDP
jgi:hypothetical protein